MAEEDNLDKSSGDDVNVKNENGAIETDSGSSPVKDSTEEKEKNVKDESKNESDDEDVDNVFEEDSKDDVDWTAPLDAIKEEEEMTSKLEKAAAKEEQDEPYREMTEEERYKKLCNLLEKSTFYSDYLQEKISKEDEASKKLKDKQLSKRKTKKRPLEEDGAGAGSPAAKKRKKHLGRSLNGEEIDDDQPLLLSGGVMRDYQIKGYLWMATLWENGINGILADEMGLGKTVQTIALICHLVEMGIPGPFLVVAPLSTIENWKREFNRFAPSLPCQIYHGTKEERESVRRNDILKKKELPELGGKTVMTTFVTTYNIAMIDAKVLARQPWKYIVVDEGHRLKNTNCKLMRDLKTYNCPNRLLLTGTPLQNNLDELWSLLNFIMPEIFDDLNVFKSWFNANDMHGRSKDEAERIVAQEKQSNILSTLHKILTPFLLRRVKSDVDLRIPPKKEVLVYCPMTAKQREFYEATVNKTIRFLVGDESKTPEELKPENADNFGRGKRSKIHVDYSVYLDPSVSESDKKIEEHFEKMRKMQQDLNGMRVWESQNSYGGYKTARQGAEVQITMRNTLSMLRKVTNHPYMIEYPLTDCGNYYRTDEAIVENCGKLKVLDQILAELEKQGGHKTLVFSQFGQMLLTILGDYLELRGYKFARLDGQMEWADRQANIDKFNTDPEVRVFLLSTRAGGLGINLTAADTIIIYDSDWNPQQDLQAQDRAHRIGQKKAVMVYRLVTAGTIDEKIVERAAAKRRLEKLIIHQKKFKSQDMEGLKATMSDVSAAELLGLLHSSDHAGIVDRKDGRIFTQAELDALLDRSDLAWKKRGQQQQQQPLTDKSNRQPSTGRPTRRSAGKEKATAAPSSPIKTNVFKVIDTDGLDDCKLKSVKEP